MSRTVYEHRILVDGVPKGEAFTKKGRLYLRRPSGSVDLFRKGSNLADVMEWARKCCNGLDVAVERIKVEDRS